MKDIFKALLPIVLLGLAVGAWWYQETTKTELVIVEPTPVLPYGSSLNTDVAKNWNEQTRRTDLPLLQEAELRQSGSSADLFKITQ